MIFAFPQSVGVELMLSLRACRGWDARLVGGAVRDTLLGKTVSDWDIAVAVAPHHFEQALYDFFGAGINLQLVGLRYGVVMAKVGDQHITLTACRRDVSSVNQRAATVEFCDDWHADAARRDFTCNAIYYDGHQMWDPFHGLGDIQNKLVRFIGNPHKRIDEDILRFWRFFRFWAWLGRGEDVDLTQHVPQLGLLSVERTRQELVKLRKGAYCESALAEIKRVGAGHFLSI